VFGFRGKPAPAGPGSPDSIGPEYTKPRPAGDGATHTGTRPWDGAPSHVQRAFDDLDQPPIGPVLVDPRHNLYMGTRYAMSWFGGQWPNQPLPDWSIVAQANTLRFHAPDSPIQQKAKAAERGGTKAPERHILGGLFPTAVVNPPQYLRHGGAAPIGIGPLQVQDFHVATDAMHPDRGNGPGSSYAHATFMGAGFAAET